MGRRFAIVTTTRSPKRRIESFVDYHKAIGFDRLYLYFDDPSDRDIDLVRGMSRVVVTPCDAELRRQWEQAPLYAANARWITSEVMARQILNACHAMKRAREDGIDWLFHLDDDELFYAAGASLDELFVEAVVEGLSVEDPFRDATYFKKNPDLLTADDRERLRRALARAGRRADSFFTAYVNGKSAVATRSELVPFGVHRFALPATDTVGRPDTVVACSGPCFVLHYPNASFTSFTEKYRRLGRFADSFFGNDPIPKGAFHTDARDIVMREDDDEAIRFYRERVITPPDLLAELRSCGLVDRIEEPGRILSDGDRGCAS
jgi:hypothetical protein